MAHVHIVHTWLCYKGKCHSNISLTAPSRVSGISVTRTVESGTSVLRVTWTTPQSDVAISQYQVQYRRSGTTSWSNAAVLSVSLPATSTVLTGLDAGTEYNIRVRAVSAAGAGEWSVEQTERTFNSELYASSAVHLMYIVYIFHYFNKSFGIQSLSTCSAVATSLHGTCTLCA